MIFMNLSEEDGIKQLGKWFLFSRMSQKPH